MNFLSKTADLKTLKDIRSDCLVVFSSTKSLTDTAKAIDSAAGKSLSQLQKQGDISGKLGSSLLIPNPSGLSADRLLIVGCGESTSLKDNDIVKLANAIAKSLSGTPAKQAHIALDDLNGNDRDQNWIARILAQTFIAGEYDYQTTKGKQAQKSAKENAPSLKKITLLGGNAATTKAFSAAAKLGSAIGNGMNVTRELGNLPGNVCTPTYLANLAKTMGRKHAKLSVKILEEKQMKELGMGSLLSVSAGSDQPAKLIVMEYNGGKKTEKPHVLVGKGITFDSGGISLKPGAAMDEMKYDMCGAASVFGAFNSLLEIEPKHNFVGIVAASENLPSGRATKPGDVVTSMSGQTIEILNTDAEGRLVLCDALTYAERFKPKSVVDIATLTGACVVALGKHATGLYANQQALADKLLAAGQQAGDRAWQMPLWDEYDQQLKSNFADMANIGGPGGGSVTAACFLSRYTKNYDWAHLDIAGTAWVSGADKGATGRPVPMLVEYLLNHA